MKNEQPKVESSIESTISEIKKAEAEKEVESEVVETEKVLIAEAVKDEMLSCNENEIESAIEKLEINIEEKERKEAKERLIEYSGKIEGETEEFEDIFNLIEQSGLGGRSFDDEFNVFLQKREEKENYYPCFTYPNLEKLPEKSFDKSENELNIIKKEILSERLNKNVVDILCDSIDYELGKIHFLKNIKVGNYEKAFELAKETWGDISDILVKKAEKVYEKKINTEEESSEVIELLKKNKFDSEDICNYFSYALKILGLDKENWKVVYGGKDIVVNYKNPENKFHTVTVPKERKVDGLKLLKLINHEIGVHALTNANNAKQGFGSLHFGKNYSLYQEGKAMLNELKIEEELLGEEKENRVVAHPYYVLAMNEVKNGKDFGEVFNHVFKLKKDELAKKSKGEETKTEKDAIDFAKKICRRIYRGFNPAENSNLYFPKDKSYFEGEIGALEMEKGGVSDYLIKAKLDPEYIAKFKKLGLFYDDKELRLTKNIANKMWKDEGWPIDYLKDKKKDKLLQGKI